VVATTYRFQFGATYQNDTAGFPIIATDMDSFIAMFPELEVDAAQVRVLKQVQDGTLYVNESLPGGRDTFALATVRIADPTKTAAIEEAIDAQFANSPNETMNRIEVTWLAERKGAFSCERLRATCIASRPS